MSKDINSPQKRSDFRVTVFYPFCYKKVKSNHESDRENSDWEYTSTLNLSAGGAAIKVGGVPLQPGDLIEFELAIRGGPLFGIAEIIRLFEEGAGRPYAAITFVSIEPKDRDRIAQVVLNEGLERHHGKAREN